MALKFCLNADKTGEITDLAPLTTDHNGASGDSVEVKVYIYNDDGANFYENIIVTPQDTTGTSEAAWVTLALDVDGEPGTYGATLALPNITDTNVHPLWVKVTVPALTPISTKTDLLLHVTADKYA